MSWKRNFPFVDKTKNHYQILDIGFGLVKVAPLAKLNTFKPEQKGKHAREAERGKPMLAGCTHYKLAWYLNSAF